MGSAAQRAAPEAVIGAVLAGGRGSRIGGGKALVELGGRPLAERAVAAVVAAGLQPLVVAKRETALPPLACEALREPDLPRHPLCGIVAALEGSGAAVVVAIGCDMPFVPPQLLAWLAVRPEPLLAARVGGRTQPFPARYDRSLLPELRRALDDERSLRATLEELAPRLLEERELAAFGPPERSCFSVNSPADLARAAALLSD